MTNQSTIDKLIEMRLTSMADAFRNQLNDPKFKEIPFEDRFAMLVDIEYSNRKNNRLKRLIRNAGFDQPEANIMDINYTSGASLTKISLADLLLANIYLNIGISLLPVQQVVEKPIWPVLLAWKHVNGISLLNISAFQICLLILRLYGQKGATEKFWPNMPTHWCLSLMNGFF